MSNNTKLMDTEPGGEQTQYEGAHTFIEPHAKEAGRLGDPSTGTTTHESHPSQKASNAPNTQGVTPAEKIRYGQAIQEGGAGGKTGGLGEARTEGGFGGTEKLEGEEDGFGKERREQGYGGANEMSREVGG